MKMVSCLATTFLVVGVAALVAAEKPNILLMLSDDHSYPYVSAYGDTNVKTPTLEHEQKVVHVAKKVARP